MLTYQLCSDCDCFLSVSFLNLLDESLCCLLDSTPHFELIPCPFILCYLSYIYLNNQCKTRVYRISIHFQFGTSKQRRSLFSILLHLYFNTFHWSSIFESVNQVVYFRTAGRLQVYLITWDTGADLRSLEALRLACKCCNNI